MFKIGDWIRCISDNSVVEVNGVDRDFITVLDFEGESHVVVKEDFDKYEQAA